MKRTLSIVGFMFFSLISFSAIAQASLSESSSFPGPLGEGGYGAAAIDLADSRGFFGSSTTFAVLYALTNTSVVTDVNLPIFGNAITANSGIAAFSNFTIITAALFDPTSGYAYFVSTPTATGSGFEKIGISGLALLTSPSSATVTSGGLGVGTAVLDSTNQFAYLGTISSPGQVVKVRLSDLTVVSSITLTAGVDFLSASVIDTSGGFAYFASSTSPGAVAQIQLSNFTQAGTLTFNAGENGVGSAVIDAAKQMAYFGTHDSPGQIVKVSLSGFTRVGAITLASGQNDLTSAVIDVGRGFAYFGTNTQPGIVVPVALSNFFAQTALTLSSGHNFLQSAVMDTANEFAYFGTYTTPGLIIQVDVLAGPPVILLQPGNVNAHPGTNATFSITADGRHLTYQWQFNGVDIPGATAASYTRTLSSADDGSTVDCVVSGANGSVTSGSASITILPYIRVYPNPWRSDQHSGVNITFDGLLANSTVKIFDLAAHWVKTLPVATGTATWDLANDQGQRVASGYYFYNIETGNGAQTVNGKIAIIH